MNNNPQNKSRFIVVLLQNIFRSIMIMQQSRTLQFNVMDPQLELLAAIVEIP